MVLSVSYEVETYSLANFHNPVQAYGLVRGRASVHDIVSKKQTRGVGRSLMPIFPRPISFKWIL